MGTLKETRKQLSPTPSLRIAIVIPTLYGYGAERVMMRVAGGLIDHGHQVDLLLFRPVIDRPMEVPTAARIVLMEQRQNDSAKDQLFRIFGTRLRQTICFDGKLNLKNCMRMLKAIGPNPLIMPSISMFKEAQFVANYVQEKTPDCILPLLPKAKVAVLLAKSLSNAFPPVIASIRSDFLNRRRREIARYRRLLPQSDHIIAVSEGVRSSVVRMIGISPTKITTIYNPVFRPDIQVLAQQTPDCPLTEGEEDLVLAVGRLSKVKDFSTLLRAFARVSGSRPARLLILGEGRQRAKLLRIARKLNIEDRVAMPGYVDNPYAFMARASVFVLSSRHEGLGNVLIEALACGCPCVSTDCPSGPAEILEGGRIGPLVPVGDDVALADAIEHMLNAPPDKQALQRKARQFSQEKAIAMYEKVIAQSVHPAGSSIRLT